ncbi:unnamed protein product [Rhizophagus irregularis]|nr:unnamed protein product [Rhizophagus irregularis]
MTKNNIDILGLTETNKLDKDIKHMNVDTKDYVIISHNDRNGAQLGKGVALIIKKQLEKHIFKIEGYKGRILKVDLSFKKNKQIRLILVYNKSGHNYMNEKIDINQKIIAMIKDAKNNKMEQILFGDFNLRYDKYKKTQDKNVFCNKTLRFFKKLEDLNLWDIHKEHYDMDNTGIIPTFISKGNKTDTRIDYIWTSEKIFQEINDAKIKKIDDVTTDHKILTISFINQGLVNTMPIIKQFRNKKVSYDYDETEENEKTKFDENLIKAVENWNNTWSIEEKWKYYKETLTKNKQKYIKKKENFVKTERQNDDINQMELYKSVKYIVFLRRHIKKLSGRTKLKQNWQQYQWHLKKHLKKLDEEAPNNYYLTRCFEIKKVFIQHHITELNEI